MAKTPATKPAEGEDASAQPEKIIVRGPYAYYDDEGNLRSWNQGQVVTDADHIADLMLRGVEFDLPTE